MSAILGCIAAAAALGLAGISIVAARRIRRMPEVLLEIYGELEREMEAREREESRT